MYRNIALVLAAIVTSHLCLANPVPDPTFGHRTHIRIHVPAEVHTVHHHHVETVPIVREVPVVHTVPVIKPVPVINTVHVPIVKTVAIEKPVLVPVREHYSYLH
ncbi:uncharacterized protein LOC119832095 [Zerene cesonia]|uniref:uncharacterized protein LOC119832095 n=1 Tax=Zerene cesonia TaxID=33412 RepID=UPI0018E579E7|nr:uncharacterized protein LOC119832095 [Zerene cesonia]